jgi:hypothetical protein
MVRPVVVCGIETGAVAEMDMKREREIIRRILEQWQSKEFGE